MSRNLFSHTKTYAKNLVSHLCRVVARQETPSAALTAISRDGKKLKRAIEYSSLSSNRKEAMHHVERGRKAYNRQEFGEAEEEFRQAIDADPKYGWGHTFLGHTLYQQNRMPEAMAAWQRAVKAEPNSEAAAKASQKLAHIQRGKDETMNWLKDRLKSG